MKIDVQVICCQITEFYNLFHNKTSNKQSLTESFFEELLSNLKMNINELFPQLVATKMKLINHLLQFLEQKPFRETIKSALSFILK